MTTHFLDEAEYCNDIILINAGKLVAGGSPIELKTRYITSPILEVRCDDVVESLELIRVEPWAMETSVFGTKLHVMVADAEDGARSHPGPAGTARASRSHRSSGSFRRSKMSSSTCSNTRRKVSRPRTADRPDGRHAMIRALRPMIVKEFRQIRRDPTSLGMLLVLPSALIILVGYALNFDVRHLPLVILDYDKTPESRAYLENFKHTEYFDHRSDVSSYADIEQLFLIGDAKIAVVSPRGIRRGSAGRQECAAPDHRGRVGRKQRPARRWRSRRG